LVSNLDLVGTLWVKKRKFPVLHCEELPKQQRENGNIYGNGTAVLDEIDL